MRRLLVLAGFLFACGSEPAAGFAGIETAAADAFGVQLGWTAHPGATAYLLYASDRATETFTEPIRELSAGETSARLDALPLRTRHYFGVRARDASGAIDANTRVLAAVTPAPPIELFISEPAKYLPATVRFECAVAVPAEMIRRVRWDLRGDGSFVEDTSLVRELDFTEAGTFMPAVEVTLEGDRIYTATRELHLAPRPELTLTASPERGPAPLRVELSAELRGVDPRLSLSVLEWYDRESDTPAAIGTALSRAASYAGGGTFHPRAVAIFSDGTAITATATISVSARELWVSSPDRRAVFRLSDPSDGHATILDRVGDLTGLAAPAAIAVDESRNALYVAVLDPEAEILIFDAVAEGNVAPRARLAGPFTFLEAPRALDVDRHSGALAVADGDRILIFGEGDAGNIAPKRVLESEATAGATAVALAADGRVVVAAANGLAAFAAGADGDAAPVAMRSRRADALSIHGDEVWAAGDRSLDAWAIDDLSARSSLRPGRGYAMPSSFTGVRVAEGGGALYLASEQRVDVFALPLSADAEPARVIAVDPASASGFALSAGGAWVLDASGFGRVLRFDASTNSAVRVDRVGGLSYGLGAAYAEDTGELFAVQQVYTDQAIRIFQRGADGKFSPSPVRTISGAQTTLSDYGYAAVLSGAELFVTTDRGSSLIAFDRHASGDVAPLRRLKGDQTALSQPGVPAVDERALEIFVPNRGGSVTVYAKDADGNTPPRRKIQGPNTLLIEPYAAAIDPDAGELFISDRTARSVFVFALSDDGDVAPRRILRPSIGAAPGHLGGIALDVSRKKLYVAGLEDGSPARIDIFDPLAEGDAPPLSSISPQVNNLRSPWQITLSAASNLLFLTQFDGVVVLDAGKLSGGRLASLSGGDALIDPDGLAYDRDRGTLYVADPGSSAIAVFRSDRGGMKAAGVIGGPRTGLVSPRGLAFDAANETLWVADIATRTVRVFESSLLGDVAPMRVIGGPATHLALPVAVASSPVWIYVVDQIGAIRGYAKDAEGDAPPIEEWAAGAPLDAAYGGGSIAVATSTTVMIASARGDSRRISGPNTRLSQPSGVAFAGDRLLVADPRRGALLIFAPDASGDALPLHEVPFSAPGRLVFVEE